MIYSLKKFSGFTSEKQIKTITSFIELITRNWDNAEKRTALIQNLATCLNSINSPFPVDKNQLKSISTSIQTANTADQFLFVTKEIWHNHSSNLLNGEAFEDTDDVISIDAYQDTAPMPLTVILDNLRSAYNTGAIIRTCECFNIQKLVFTGYTPTPKNSKVKKTARSTEDKINWQYHKDPIEVIKYCKDQGQAIIALETTEKAEFIHKVTIPHPAVLILGNEALGVAGRILSHTDIVIKIPVRGWKNSLNVATAYGIACFEIYRQWFEKDILTF